MSVQKVFFIEFIQFALVYLVKIVDGLRQSSEAALILYPLQYYLLLVSMLKCVFIPLKMICKVALFQKERFRKLRHQDSLDQSKTFLKRYKNGKKKLWFVDGAMCSLICSFLISFYFCYCLCMCVKYSYVCACSGMWVCLCECVCNGFWVSSLMTFHLTY